jgi:DNA-binding LytR/AlgR family response regulator
MRLLIIEDEPAAQHRLTRLLAKLRPAWTLIDTLDTVKDAVTFLKNSDGIDLIFLDIQLADGNSFSIFKEVNVRPPVIFTTAFDAYAIDAFKFNSIDYLLKPIDSALLEKALCKFEQHFRSVPNYNQLLLSMERLMEQKKYKQRFLIHIGDQLKSIPTSDISYFYSADSLSHAMLHSGRAYPIDQSLDALEHLLHPNEFFRISRRFIVHHEAIKSIEQWFNGRLKVDLIPLCPLESTVSRERVQGFKTWLDK